MTVADFIICREDSIKNPRVSLQQAWAEAVVWSHLDQTPTLDWPDQASFRSMVTNGLAAIYFLLWIRHITVNRTQFQYINN